MSGAMAPVSIGAILLCLNRRAIAVCLALQVVYMDRIDLVCKIESENPRVEIQLAVERSLDVLGLAKSMLLALEWNISDRQPLCFYGGIHHLGLVWRYDLVLQALKQNDRARQAIGEMNRGAPNIEFSPLGVGRDETVAVARLEFVALFLQRFEIADPVVAGARLERVPESQCRKRRVTA